MMEISFSQYLLSSISWFLAGVGVTCIWKDITSYVRSPRD